MYNYFQVFDKAGKAFKDSYVGKVYNVFDVTYDKCGYPQFLIHYNGAWHRISAKHFCPYV